MKLEKTLKFNLGFRFLLSIKIRKFTAGNRYPRQNTFETQQDPRCPSRLRAQSDGTLLRLVFIIHHKVK